ncbi:MAG: hemerythrin domain-containing protein [Rhodoferax sp.]|nr:hemerythrin domain-containing protein [Rhodoferax sp.]MDP3652385.1 hemerythrin domain-containing protein [Rhodoferax sp.]
MTQATPRPLLVWSEALALDLPLMDDTHHEFVDLLATVVQAPEGQLLNAWRALIAHTQDHFDREDQWMQSTGFSSSNCHATQHKVILQVMREGEKRGVTGEYAVVRQMADELGVWFPQHAQSMDAALALHLRSVGYDATTGQVHRPQAPPTQTLHGCGGATCSDTDEQTEIETTQAPL